MAYVIKLLDKGYTAANTLKKVYEVPSGVLGAVVTNIRFVNDNPSTSTTIDLYLKKGANTARLILDKSKTLAAKDYFIIKNEFTLEPGDKIEMTTTAANIYFVVSGIEKIS